VADEDDFLHWSRLELDRSIENCLASGSFGHVYKARLDGVLVAAKVTTERVRDQNNHEDKSTHPFRQLLREIRRYRRMRNINVVQFLGALVEPSDSRNLVVVTEFMQGGSLSDALGTIRAMRLKYLEQLFPELRIKTSTELSRYAPKLESVPICLTLESIIRIALHVARGLQYLHAEHISHGDLKPGNILLSAHLEFNKSAGLFRLQSMSSVKLTDFGLSRREALLDTQVIESGKGPQVGTMAYLPPEAFSGEPVDLKTAEKGDIYAFALVLYELLTALRPWDGLSPSQLYGALVGADLRPVVPSWTRRLYNPPHICESLIQLIEACWQRESIRRPSAQMVASLLENLLTASTDASGTAKSSLSQATHDSHIAPKVETPRQPNQDEFSRREQDQQNDSSMQSATPNEMDQNQTNAIEKSSPTAFLNQDIHTSESPSEKLENITETERGNKSDEAEQSFTREESVPVKQSPDNPRSETLRFILESADVSMDRVDSELLEIERSTGDSSGSHHSSPAINLVPKQEAKEQGLRRGKSAPTESPIPVAPIPNEAVGLHDAHTFNANNQNAQRPSPARYRASSGEVNRITDPIQEWKRTMLLLQDEFRRIGPTDCVERLKSASQSMRKIPDLSQRLNLLRPFLELLTMMYALFDRDQSAVEAILRTINATCGSDPNFSGELTQAGVIAASVGLHEPSLHGRTIALNAFVSPVLVSLKRFSDSSTLFVQVCGVLCACAMLSPETWSTLVSLESPKRLLDSASTALNLSSANSSVSNRSVSFGLLLAQSAMGQVLCDSPLLSLVSGSPSIQTYEFAIRLQVGGDVDRDAAVVRLIYAVACCARPQSAKHVDVSVQIQTLLSPGTERIIFLMNQHNQSVGFQLDACIALRELYAEEKKENAERKVIRGVAANAGAVEALTRVLITCGLTLDAPMNSRGCLLAARALAPLFVESSARERAARCGALQCLLQVLERVPTPEIALADAIYIVLIALLDYYDPSDSAGGADPSQIEFLLGRALGLIDERTTRSTNAKIAPPAHSQKAKDVVSAAQLRYSKRKQPAKAKSAAANTTSGPLSVRNLSGGQVFRNMWKK